MPTNHYDLIVLGDDFSGLVAATLCARRGMRVLCATTARAPTSYQLGPYKLPTEALPLVGLASPAVRRVLDELHFQHLLKRKLRTAHPAFQLVGPDLRVAVDSDENSLARELERELGGTATDPAAVAAAGDEASRLVSHLDPVFSMDIAVPPTGFWERREIGRTADRLVDDATRWSHKLGSSLARALFSLPGVFGSNCDPAALGDVTRARAFAEWRQGVSRLPGDWEALRAVFLDKFTSHNGEVRAVVPEALSTSWGKVTGLVLEGGEELGAAHMVSALPIAELAPLCEKKVAKRLYEVGEGMEVGAYRYTLNLVLDAVGVPEGMGAHVLVVGDPDQPLAGDNALALYADQPDSEARILLTVQAICPAPQGGGAGALDDMLANLRVAVRQRLESVMPFHSDHVLLAHSPHESAPPEGLGPEVEMAQILAPRPLWRMPPEPLLGVAGLPYQVGIKQLTLGSSQILPGLGLEGEMAVGWCVAKLVCEALGKKKDYLRDDVLTVGRG
jgi:phytoene dehydrogenase-like protein